MTHEEFISAIAAAAAVRLDPHEAAAVASIKLAYGAGENGVRGVTYYARWNNGSGAVPFVALNALHQESKVQLAGTTLHELGHVLAGWEAAHGRPWHEACGRLGLRCVRAAGTAYTWAHFAPDIREAIIRLPEINDGAPVAGITRPNGAPIAVKPCSAGVGTKGGKSRGTGSGSRLRLFECSCEPPIKVRVARDEFDCTCNTCSTVFLRH